jgi:hypothetical protein
MVPFPAVTLTDEEHQQRQPFKDSIFPSKKVRTVTLSEEELQECQAFEDSMFPSKTEEGVWVMAKKLEPFNASMVALCMMARAKRLAQLKQPAEACQAATKACLIYPLSVYFYDYACLLEAIGRPNHAKAMFAEFLRRYDLGPVEAKCDEVALTQRDLSAMLEYAKSRTGAA